MANTAEPEARPNEGATPAAEEGKAEDEKTNHDVEGVSCCLACIASLV